MSSWEDEKTGQMANRWVQGCLQPAHGHLWASCRGVWGQLVKGQHPPTKTKQGRWGAICYMFHSLKKKTKQNTRANIPLLVPGAQTWSCLKDGRVPSYCCVLYQLALAVSFYWARPSEKRAEYGPQDSSLWWADDTSKTGGGRQRCERRQPEKGPWMAWDLFLGKSANETIP